MNWVYPSHPLILLEKFVKCTQDLNAFAPIQYCSPSLFYIVMGLGAQRFGGSDEAGQSQKDASEFFKEAIKWLGREGNNLSITSCAALAYIALFCAYDYDEHRASSSLTSAWEKANKMGLHLQLNARELSLVTPEYRLWRRLMASGLYGIDT